MGLLDYAAHMWRVSSSPLPPALEDVLHRDKQWDYEVARMKQNHDYWIQKQAPQKKPNVSEKNTIQWGAKKGS